MANIEFPRRVCNIADSPVSNSKAGISVTKSRGVKNCPVSFHCPLLARANMMMSENKPNCSDTRINEGDGKNGVSQVSPRGLSNSITGATLNERFCSSLRQAEVVLPLIPVAHPENSKRGGQQYRSTGRDTYPAFLLSLRAVIGEYIESPLEEQNRRHLQDGLVAD